MDNVYMLTNSGFPTEYGLDLGESFGIRPTITLNKNIKIDTTKGDGQIGTPYIIN